MKGRSLFLEAISRALIWVGLENIGPAVERFGLFARQHKELKFYVTAIGCGIAGYQREQIAPMFLKAAHLDNVYLPVSFWKVILKQAGGDCQRCPLA